ncbi:FliM/FliN family flagellar motor switch protein [Photobacterium sp. BZF1]|uniref:FliM/FliN family flagellar motor switch protein n=1 Tax=Photobacterium sp. BZF1 TaxID=1904457 RepID=UPI001653D180|nr:FliM/FliN family flagellar motor switch protein [Photobacterium sp. BZF1]MBC7001595.1 FliM/FliN family flagellar motor switch protein [Photobacterium sp. BZF1]
MKRSSLTELGNPSIKMRKFLLKHTNHFINEIISLLKFNFSERKVDVLLSEISDIPQDHIKTVLNIESLGNIFFFISPQGIDLLLHRHLNTTPSNNTFNTNSNDIKLTQTHHRLFQKLAMTVTNIMTADAKHFAVENAETPPSDIGISMVFKLDEQEIKVAFMIDENYVKKLREMMETNETFDKDEILDTLRHQPVELGCVMLYGQCTMLELAQLKPGDILSMTMCKNLTVKVNGHPTFFGKLQSIDSQLGIEING